MNDQRKSWVHFVAGGLGGCISATITCPLDVIRTRLQALNKGELGVAREKYRLGLKTLGLVHHIYRKEGIKGLWRGLVPNLLGIMPSRSVYFASYAFFKNLYTKRWKESNLTNLIAAVSSGVVTASAVNPIWVVKTRLQLHAVHNSNLKLSIKDCIYKMYKEEGVRGFYNGLAASYLGVIESSIQLSLYEFMKKSIREHRRNTNQDLTFHTVDYLMISSLAKLFASALTYPHEVVRTRFREQRNLAGTSPKYKNIIQAFKLIAVEEGVRGLYGGMSAHLFRVVPNAAIMFLTVEKVCAMVS